MPEKLFVLCPVCDGTFPSPIQVTREAFEHSRLTTMDFPCHTCGAPVLGGEGSMFFVDV